FGADPLTEAPPPRTLSDLVTGKPAAQPEPPPSLPAFNSEDVPSLLGLPKMQPTLGNETVRAATSLLTGGGEARLLRAGLERVVALPGGLARLIRAFDLPKPWPSTGLIAGRGAGTAVAENSPDMPAPLKITIPVASALAGGLPGHVVGSGTANLLSTAG